MARPCSVPWLPNLIWIDYEESPFKNLHYANFQGQMLSFISPSSNFAPQANNNNNNNKNNKNNNHNHNNTDKFPVKNMFFRVLTTTSTILHGKVVGGDWGVEIIGNSGFGLGLWTTLWKAQGLAKHPRFFFPLSKWVGWVKGWGLGWKCENFRCLSWF